MEILLMCFLLKDTIKNWDMVGGICWWKVPWLLLESGLRKLETDKDLLKMCKTYRRNYNFMNIFFEHGVSEPHVVEYMSEDDEVILPKNASLLKLPSTQPATQVTKNTFQPTKSHSQPSKTNLLHSPSKNIAKASPTSAGPNPHPKKMDYVQSNTRSSQPTQKPINKPNSQPTQKPKSKPKFQQKIFSQPAKSCTDPLKPIVKPRSGHQPPKKSHAQNKNKDPLQFVRSGRPVKPPQFKMIVTLMTHMRVLRTVCINPLKSWEISVTLTVAMMTSTVEGQGKLAVTHGTRKIWIRCWTLMKRKLLYIHHTMKRQSLKTSNLR
nr:uncharacterized protein LOC112715313 [Arachis hypogaea]